MEWWNQEGLFPQILNGIFGASSPTAPDPTARPAQPLPDYPSVNIDKPSAEMLRQAQVMFPTAAPTQLGEWIAKNPEMFKYGPGLGNPSQPLSAMAGGAKKPDIGDALGKATGALGGGTGGAAGGLGGGTPYFPPAPPALGRGGGGGGGGGAMVSPISAASQLAMGQLPGLGGPGYPLGPASTSPFVIALMKQRLGMS